MAGNNSRRGEGLPPAMTRLVRELSRLPGIGEKTASRLAFALLHRAREDVIALAEALLEMKERTSLCSGCFGLSDNPQCQICADEQRDHEIVCVVEGPADLMALERSRSFNGVYHVLHGALSPLDGIGPDDLKVKELMARLDQNGARDDPRSDHRDQRHRRGRSDLALSGETDEAARDQNHPACARIAGRRRSRIQRLGDLDQRAHRPPRTLATDRSSIRQDLVWIVARFRFGSYARPCAGAGGNPASCGPGFQARSRAPRATPRASRRPHRVRTANWRRLRDIRPARNRPR